MPSRSFSLRWNLLVLPVPCPCCSLGHVPLRADPMHPPLHSAGLGGFPQVFPCDFLAGVAAKFWAQRGASSVSPCSG